MDRSLIWGGGEGGDPMNPAALREEAPKCRVSCQKMRALDKEWGGKSRGNKPASTDCCRRKPLGLTTRNLGAKVPGAKHQELQVLRTSENQDFSF